MPDGEIRLSKHHGAGNDFLVSMDLDDTRPFSTAEVRALCDRHRGVGADGVLRVLVGNGPAALSMDLRNADGSVAEMSGNGIRCLVQAAVESEVVATGDVAVMTGAGIREVAYEILAPGLGRASVDMGPAVLGPELRPEVPPGVETARSVDMGNPHLVLLLGAPADDQSVIGAGALLQGSVPGGVNVEFAWLAPRGDTVCVRVFERGVGETLACGTGACAVAAAVHSWGMVGDVVQVEMPGGTLEVLVGDDTVLLTGPVRKVAEVVVRAADLAELVSDLDGDGRATSSPLGGEVVGRR